MPVFDYICHACGQVFEKLILGQNIKVKCPFCESENIEKKISTFAVGRSQPQKGGCPKNEQLSCPSSACCTPEKCPL